MVSVGGEGKAGSTGLGGANVNNLIGLWGVGAIWGCLVLALGWWGQRNNGPECESLREEVGWDVGSGLIGLHVKDVLCRLALGKAVSLALVRPQMLQIRIKRQASFSV